MRWKSFERSLRDPDREYGPQPDLRRGRQVYIIGLWGEKDGLDESAEAVQEECLLAAVGADGRLRGLSAEQARFCRTWRERAIAAGGSGMQIMFRAQWDAWHSKWVWAAATMEDSVGDQAGGDAGLDTHDLEANSADDGAFAVADHKIAIETELQWTAAGDGGDGGCYCWPLMAAGVVAEHKDDDGRDAAAEDVKALVRELMWTSAGDGGDDGWCYWPSVTGVAAARKDDECVTGACLSIASRASLVPKNNGAETQVLQDVSLPKSRRLQVARLATACATDTCSPLASRTCRNPKNNGEETRRLQDASLPKSRSLQVGTPQGARQVLCLSGLPLRCPSWARISTLNPFRCQPLPTV